jgi:hypothetical protein
MHPDRLMVLAPRLMEVYAGAADALATPGAIEWCRQCGALRFDQKGRFIVPEKGRVS